MLICEKCFKDNSIIFDIEQKSETEGNCDVCGKHGNLVDLDEIRDFFDELIQLFQIDDTSDDTIVTLIQKEWGIFADDGCAEAILTAVLSSNGSSISVADKVSYNSTIKEGEFVWENLKKEIRENSRFFSKSDILDDNYALFERLTLHKNDKLFRARITPAERRKFKPKDMGCPPAELSKAGRSNPLGISYLYLSRDIETTYYEVRATFLDNVSVGKFVVSSDLDLIDFDSERSIYSIYNDGSYTLADIVLNKKLMKAISADMSKPLRRYDTELEYIPTQWICEYCKVKLGADGVSFKSALQDGGKNIVLFDPAKAKCISVESHVIRRISIARN